MRDNYFKLCKWVLIVWTSFMIGSSIILAIMSGKIAEQWFKSYNTTNTNHKQVIELKNNETDKTHHYYELSFNFGNGTKNDQKTDIEIVKQTYMFAFIVIVVIIVTIGVFFNILGLIGALKQNRCLTLTYAIYMTVSTVVFFINGFTFNYEWIFAVKYFIITVIAYCFASGIRERRFKPLNVAVVSYGKPIIMDGNEVGTNIPQNMYPQPEILRSDALMNIPSITPPVLIPQPTAPPPLPPTTGPPIDFNNFPKW